MDKSGDRTSGMYVSLSPADAGGYNVTIDSQGREIDRQKTAPAGRGGGPGGAPGGRGGTAGAGRGVIPMPVKYPLPANFQAWTEDSPWGFDPNGWNRVQIYSYYGAVKVEVNGAAINGELMVYRDNACGAEANPGAEEGGLSDGRPPQCPEERAT